MFVAVAFLGAGCASDSTISRAEKPQSLRAGMTKKQVSALYGPADDVRVRSEGDTWIYHLNVGKQLVPWNLGYAPEIRLIQFDPSGKVKSWSQTK